MNITINQEYEETKLNLQIQNRRICLSLRSSSARSCAFCVKLAFFFSSFLCLLCILHRLLMDPLHNLWLFGWQLSACSKKGLEPLYCLTNEEWCCSHTTHFTKYLELACLFSEHTNIFSCHIGESQFVFPERSTHFTAAAVEYDDDDEAEAEAEAEAEEGKEEESANANKLSEEEAEFEDDEKVKYGAGSSESIV
jgi:hypothetical protein